MGVLLVGGVELSAKVYEHIKCTGHIKVSGVIGYAKRFSRRSGYVDMESKLWEKELYCATADINSAEAKDFAETCDPEAVLVTGWSQLLGKWWLDNFECAGLHPTLLPEGRGRAPIPWTILNGLTRSGVTLFKLSAQADEGEIYGQTSYAIAKDETSRTLYNKACQAALSLVSDFLPDMIRRQATTYEQERPLLYALPWPKRTPEDSEVELYSSDEYIDRHLRALTDPYPRPFVRTASGKKLLLEGWA